MTRITSLALVLSSFLVSSATPAADADWARVDQILGRKGAEQAGGIHRYGLPRTDLKVTLDGVAIKPAFALGGWLAFQPMGSNTMVMGDLVLTETEINPVMKKLLDDGLEVTAIHNHLLRTSTPVFYMHVGGHGDPAKLAESVRAALVLSKTPLSQAPSSPPPAVDLDTAALEKTLGAKGTNNGGVYQFGIPRAETVSEGGMDVAPTMGISTAINFQPTGTGKAAVTGDFVLLAKEVNPVMKTLRQNGIEVTALHSHMVDETPRLYFMHFWANDDAQKLATALKAAVDQTNSRRAQ